MRTVLSFGGMSASLETSQIVGSFILAIIGIVFYLLGEDNLPDMARLAKWLVGVPSQESRRSHFQLVLGLVAGMVLALVPWGFGLMDSRPCLAWFFYALAFCCGAYSFWQMAALWRWVRLTILALGVGVFCFYARKTIYANTELDFFFVNPGVYLPSTEMPNGPPGWLFLVNGEHTGHPIFSADMFMQDAEMVQYARAEEKSNPNEAAKLIEKSVFEKHYPEINSVSEADKLTWRPLNVNKQDYVFSATYRIGERSYQSTEELRIVNVGEEVTYENRMKSRPVWVYDFTIKNQPGTVLVHCVDKKFPHDDRWVDGPPCFPGAKYSPFPRSLCKRCFGRGFEWSSEENATATTPSSPAPSLSQLQRTDVFTDSPKKSTTLPQSPKSQPKAIMSPATQPPIRYAECPDPLPFQVRQIPVPSSVPKDSGLQAAEVSIQTSQPSYRVRLYPRARITTTVPYDSDKIRITLISNYTSQMMEISSPKPTTEFIVGLLSPETIRIKCVNWEN